MARNAQPDLSEFLANQSSAGRRSIIDRVLVSVTPEQREKLIAALQSQEIGSDAIAATVTKWGHKISGSAVHYHRKANGWR